MFGNVGNVAELGLTFFRGCFTIMNARQRAEMNGNGKIKIGGKTMTNPNGKNHFIGDYVDDVRDAQIAGLLANKHVVILGAPGYGKTAIARDMADRIAGRGNWTFTRLDPSTPVDVVGGAWNPAKLLDGELERVTDGTPYQNGNRIAILDEIFRASEPMFDKLLDVCDRQDVDNGDAPVVIGTANFVIHGDRTEALIDRFALWVWVDTTGIDIDEILDALFESNGKPSTPGDLPTWDQIETVRGYEPDAETRDVVKRFIKTLESTVAPEGRKPHPRRLEQWRQIVYRVSAYEHGSPTFDVVSPMAARVMRFAWPNTSPDMSGEWSTFVAASVDPIGGAVDKIMADAVVEFRRVARLPGSSRSGELNSLGAFNIAQQETLREIAREHGDDPRINAAMVNLTSWFGLAASGIVDGIK